MHRESHKIGVTEGVAEGFRGDGPAMEGVRISTNIDAKFGVEELHNTPGDAINLHII